MAGARRRWNGRPARSAAPSRIWPPSSSARTPCGSSISYAKMTRFSFWPLGAIGMSARSRPSIRRCGTSRARHLGVPVWQLLGGQVRDQVRVYTHLRRARIGAQVATDDISAFCDAVQETVEMGYNADQAGLRALYAATRRACCDVRHVEKAGACRARAGRARRGDHDRLSRPPGLGRGRPAPSSR